MYFTHWFLKIGTTNVYFFLFCITFITGIKLSKLNKCYLRKENVSAPVAETVEEMADQ